ncbi:hypothetical protein ACFVUS_12570 [Nocardia sp. NPDC058058]|uniref:hypothetical protein n=1 Tax=Nocardia sp. NPDC058058 TaxID=3346317 RepID=UPI0036DB04B7
MSEHIDEIQTQVERLAAHGRSVWDAIDAGYKLDASTRVLVLQVCRLVDRLDRLEAALKSNKTWIRIAEESQLGPDAVKITVTVDSVLAEARQQSTALMQLLHKLGVGKLEDQLASQGNSFNEQFQRILGL